MIQKNSNSLWPTARIRFRGWDRNKDGHLTNQEVESALKRPKLSHDEKAALETFRGRQSELEEAHNDEFLDERRGTTLRDIDTFERSGTDAPRRLEEQFRIERALSAEPKSVKDEAAAHPDRPAQLSEKIGSRDYYLERYKDFRRRNPSDKAPDYYLNYGLKYFDRFHAQKDGLQPQSREWVDRTGVALQQKMENRNNGADFARLERSDGQFKSFAYDTHPSAYLESGLQKLPYGDRIKIGLTPDASDLFTPGGLKQVAQTGGVLVVEDVKQAAETVGNWIGGLF